jgi:hypothetical protein
MRNLVFLFVLACLAAGCQRGEVPNRIEANASQVATTDPFDEFSNVESSGELKLRTVLVRGSTPLYSDLYHSRSNNSVSLLVGSRGHKVNVDAQHAIQKSLGNQLSSHVIADSSGSKAVLSAPKWIHDSPGGKPSIPYG